MNEVTIGIIGLAVILLMFLTGIELGFAMAIVGFVGFSIIVSTKAALNLLAKDIFDVFASYGFTVIPLFVLMGQIAFNAGIAKRLYSASYKFIGHIPGGLAMATVAAATAFKALCGYNEAEPNKTDDGHGKTKFNPRKEHKQYDCHANNSYGDFIHIPLRRS